MKIMYKIELLALLCAVLFCMTSCKKEGSAVDSSDADTGPDCIVTLLRGTAYVTNGDDEAKNGIAVGDMLGENSAVTTEADSTVELQIGEGSVIRIKEQSKVLIKTLYADEEKENTGLFLETGKLLAEPELKSEESSFEVATNTVTAGVRGTEFVIVEEPGKVTKIAVNEGKVSVRKQLTIDNIETLKDLNQEVGEDLEEAIATEIILEPDEKLEVTEEKVREIEKQVEARVSSIIEKLEQSAQGDDTDKKSSDVLEDIETVQLTEISTLVGGSIEKEEVTSSEWETEFNRQEFEEIKVRTISTSQSLRFEEAGSVEGTFSGRDTYIAFDDANIYITSGNAGTLYCYNLKKGELLWSFINPGEAKLGSPAIPYKKSLILGTFTGLYAVNKKNGAVDKTIPLENGPVFWAAPVVSNGKAYIPTSRQVYVYDGKDFTGLEKMESAKGQMYIDVAYNLLFINEGLSRTIKVYNLVSDSLIYKPAGLMANAFMKPAVLGDYFVIADRSGRIYKYNYAAKTADPQVLRINTGIVTPFTVSGTSLYFIGLDGKLYKMDAQAFTEPVELAAVEEKTDMNSMLVKNLVLYKDKIYYAGSSGRVFSFSLETSQADFFETPSGKDLVGSPVIIDKTIYVMNTEGKVFSKPVE